MAKRPTREWLIRGAMALGAVILGYISVSHALANVIVKADAASAHRLAPGDGRITAAFAAHSFSATPDSATDSEPALLAVKALRQDATAVDALNVLGLQAQLRSDEAAANRFFGYSVSLSRRELQPQLWAIEEAVARGDIERVLRNYDVALRTSRQAQTVLFPILASAIAQPRIRASLLPILHMDPVWMPSFLRYAASRGRDPLASAQLFREGTGLPIEDADRARVVTRMAAQGLMDEAWAYYVTFRRAAAKDRSRDPRFELGMDTTSTFDWTIGNTPGLSASILKDGESGFLDFATPTSAGATVVSQTQLLPPGAYRLEGRSKGLDQPERSSPYWVLACRAGPELGRIAVPNSQRDGGRFSGSFIVPQNCPVQILSLVARASDRIAGVSGQISYLSLVPANDE